MPFQITNKDVGIEIIDPLSAEILGIFFFHHAIEFEDRINNVLFYELNA